MSKDMNKPEKKELVVFAPEQKIAYKKICNQISGSVRNLENNYLKLAVALSTAESEKLYEVGGYQNVYDFAKERYNLSRSTVCRYISLVSVFGITEESKPLYTANQMIEMLPYVRSGGSLEHFSPDMSLREIRSKVKELSPAPSSVKKSSSVSKRDVLLSFSSVEDWDAKHDGIFMLVNEAIEQGRTVQIIAC